jgi:hypothetical protein
MSYIHRISDLENLAEQTIWKTWQHAQKTTNHTETGWDGVDLAWASGVLL